MEKSYSHKTLPTFLQQKSPFNSPRDDLISLKDSNGNQKPKGFYRYDTKAYHSQIMKKNLDQEYQDLVINTIESVPQVQRPSQSFTGLSIKLVSRQQRRKENKHIYQASIKKQLSPEPIPFYLANRTIEDKIPIKNRFERVHDIISGDVRGQFKLPKIENIQSLKGIYQSTRQPRYDPFKRNAVYQLQDNSVGGSNEFQHELGHLGGHIEQRKLTNRDLYVQQVYSNPNVKFTKLKQKDYVVNPITNSLTQYQQLKQNPSSEYNIFGLYSNQSVNNRDYLFKTKD